MDKYLTTEEWNETFSNKFVRIKGVLVYMYPGEKVSAGSNDYFMIPVVFVERDELEPHPEYFRLSEGKMIYVPENIEILDEEEQQCLSQIYL